MRQLALVLFLAVLHCLGCSSLAAPKLPVLQNKLSPAELIAMEGGSTVALVTRFEQIEDDGTGKDVRPFCTGVWVADNYILTAEHCAEVVREQIAEKRQGPTDPFAQMLQQIFGVQEENKVDVPLIGIPMHYVQENEVTQLESEPSAWHLAAVVAHDAAHDLALLHAEGHAVPPHKVAKLADKAPEIGAPLHIVGHQSGFYWTYIEGNVAAYRGKLFGEGQDSSDPVIGPWMQANAPVYFGNSGGGAYNDKGELVGIADRIARAPNVAFFVHIESIRAFLKSAGVLTSTKK